MPKSGVRHSSPRYPCAHLYYRAAILSQVVAEVSNGQQWIVAAYGVLSLKLPMSNLVTLRNFLMVSGCENGCFKDCRIMCSGVLSPREK